MTDLIREMMARQNDETTVSSETVEATTTVFQYDDEVSIVQRDLNGGSQISFDSVDTAEAVINELEQWVDDNTETVVPLGRLQLGDAVDFSYEGRGYSSGREITGRATSGGRNVYASSNDGEDIEELVVLVEVDSRINDLELVKRDDDDSIKVRNAETKTMLGDVVELSVVG